MNAQGFFCRTWPHYWRVLRKSISKQLQLSSMGPGPLRRQLQQEPSSGAGRAGGKKVLAHVISEVFWRVPFTALWKGNVAGSLFVPNQTDLACKPHPAEHAFCF